MSAKPADPLFDFARYMGEFKFPMMDMEILVTGQQRNVEALTRANRIAYDGFQAVMKRQADIVRQAMDDMGRATREFAEAGTAQDKAARQAEMAKGAYERGVGNFRELTDMIAKVNTEAFNLLHQRFTDGIDEWREALGKAPRH